MQTGRGCRQQGDFVTLEAEYQKLKTITQSGVVVTFEI